uniref:Uncharacterized protein n=1 Tax=Manihot esculenta TaxID=3983 RepID=A0A2C9UXG4_MANES
MSTQLSLPLLCFFCPALSHSLYNKVCWTFPNMHSYR